MRGNLMLFVFTWFDRHLCYALLPDDFYGHAFDLSLSISYVFSSYYDVLLA